jgi:CheY-like chemotaxis protein
LSASVSNRSVLIIDDDQEARLALERECGRRLKGYRVLSAGDGLEAIDLHKRHQTLIAAVVLDGEITTGQCQIESFEVLQRILEAGFSGPIVAASGRDSVRKRQMEAGCTHAIQSIKSEVPALLATLLPTLP